MMRNEIAMRFASYDESWQRATIKYLYSKVAEL